MRTITTILLLLIATSLPGQIRKDYQDHFVVGAALGMTTTMAAYTSTESEWKTVSLAIAVPLVIGAGKELYDMTGRGTPEWNDLFYTVAGGVAGYAATRLWMLGMDRISRKKRHEAINRNLVLH